MRILIVVYDNGSYIHEFPIGLAYIASVLKSNGFEVTIYNQDVHHYPEKHLTEYLNQNEFDVVCVGVIGGYYQYWKLLKISEAINRSRNRPFYVIGGHGPAPEPEYFLLKSRADAAVIGEGEITVIELLEAVAQKGSLKDIKGIAFRDGDEVTVNERRELIADIDSIPFPAYDMFPIEYYRLLRMPHVTASDFVMQILSGRGCKFKCTFCFRLDSGLRLRSNEGVIEEIRYLQKDYGINYIAFMDELLMSSAERTIDLCEALIQANLNIKWECSGRLNYAKPEVIRMMKKAGCVFIYYGIEAMNDQVLRNIKKGLTTKQIVSGIETTLREGISPSFNLMFGNIGDSKETLDRGVEFLLKYDDGAQFRTIRPVTPYPGSPLYDYAIEKGLIKDVADFYENKHLNSDLLSANFTDMSDDEVYQCLFEANSRLIDNYYQRKNAHMLAQARNLYFEKDANFRGFRQT